MGYELVTIENLNRIKELLKNTALSDSIEINIPNLDLSLTVDAVSYAMQNEEYLEEYSLYMEKK
jgi:hypothetical protein